MKYRGVIFDLDGVICSTDEYHYLAWKALAERLNIPFDRERNNLLRGVSRAASLNIILEKSDQTYTDEEKAALAEEKNMLYRELLGNMSTADLSDDVKITLEALRTATVWMKWISICWYLSTPCPSISGNRLTERSTAV